MPAQVRFLAVAALLLVGTMGALLGGCATTTGTVSAPAAVPDLSPLMVTACLDRTPSYDRAYFDDAKNLLADAILQRAESGQPGATIYVTLIGSNSYQPSATVRTIVVPSTPGFSMTSTPGGNIFNGGIAQQTATAAAQAAASQTSKVVQQLQPDITFLRSLNPRTESPTDILGCISRASERFQAAPANTQKLLLLATDLQEEGPQQSDKTRSLGGVTVKVIDWKCDDATVCDGLKTAWHDEYVTRDQVALWSCFDPAETKAEVAGHLFDLSGLRSCEG